MEVLKDFTYHFESSYIYGLHGRNGSGKTMLLRALSGLIVINSGKITINNKELHKDMSFPDSVGIIIENTQLLPQYSAFTNLKLLSKIKNVATDEDIKEAILRVGLDPTSKVTVKKFSLGMKQRLSIAQAIFEKPDILLLDEPTNAIDTKGIDQIRNILIEEKNRGALIIIASHNQDDLNILCDKILLIEEGRLINND
ncbi:ATP-binding cassette domain-containing protein [Peribacillus frigoritolerans]|uniref:ATP-binding cassette domain-containing protein n=1 Tax=Peribacillus frigoritolerans TaxID=450367 RepID=UPI002281C63E|nr:ABC transporter ATP-binding protein [Peribacillus frigoritolerans]MCY8935674.1 ABC transporter ATP-binding protein [Peribacillus frigoritolerans]